MADQSLILLILYFLFILRYYNRHLPGSLFVLEHMRNYSSHSPPEVLKAAEPQLQHMGINYTYWKLFGDAYGFPVHWLVWKAQEAQQRIFRAGYKCVLYTDVDEFIVPDPIKYPDGLGEYLEKFVADPNKQSQRVGKCVEF